MRQAKADSRALMALRASCWSSSGVCTDLHNLDAPLRASCCQLLCVLHLDHCISTFWQRCTCSMENEHLAAVTCPLSQGVASQQCEGGPQISICRAQGHIYYLL